MALAGLGALLLLQVCRRTCIANPKHDPQGRGGLTVEDYHIEICNPTQFRSHHSCAGDQAGILLFPKYRSLDTP